MFYSKDKIKIVGFPDDDFFNPGQVMACAIISILYPNINIQRSNNIDILDKCDIIFDIGRSNMERIFNYKNNFEYYRPNKIPFATAGIAWQLFGVKILDILNINKKECVNVFNKIDEIMSEIDQMQLKNDINMKFGIYPIIISFNSPKNNLIQNQINFKQAIKFTKNYLLRQIEKFESENNNI